MFAFAIDNIFRMASNKNSSFTTILSEQLFSNIQFFLLGVSTIYIVQNFLLLYFFLPNKHGNYKEDLKRNIENHIERFSQDQLNLKYAVIIILLSSGIYIINYLFPLLPKHTMIWLVLVIVPLILNYSMNWYYRD